MAILSKGNTFATGDQVTALKLNNLVDSATFASGAVDDSTTQLNGSGQIIVKDSGITSAKLNLSATGASQTIATFKTTQTNDSGTFNRSLNIRTPASTSDINSPFEITTENGIQFICDDHTVTIDSDGKTIFGNGNIESVNTGLYQVNINTDNALGSTAGNEQGILRLVEQAGNTDNLLFTSQRVSDGSDWTTAAHRIQRKVDATKQGYIQFGNHTETNGGLVTFGENETERMRIDAEGHVGIGTTTPSEALQVVGDIKATDTTDSVVVRQNGSIELNRASNPFIDFKNAASDDHDCRIIQASDGFQFLTGGNDLSGGPKVRVTLTSDGLVQINGATSDGNSILRLETSGDSDTSALQFADTSSDNVGQIGYVHSDNSMRFTVNASERVRIDSSGSVMIGTTTALGNGLTFVPSADNGALRATFDRPDTSNESAVLVFQNNSTNVGFIKHDNSSTTYSTSSDYRLKEDVIEMQDSISRVQALKPVNFAWKLDGRRVDGFLAHEAQEVVPEAVTGTKDAVDEDGQPDYQGIDQSKLVPLLTKALQEALTKIESLEARVAALES